MSWGRQAIADPKPLLQTLAFSARCQDPPPMLMHCPRLPLLVVLDAPAGCCCCCHRCCWMMTPLKWEKTPPCQPDDQYRHFTQMF